MCTLAIGKMGGRLIHGSLFYYYCPIGDLALCYDFGIGYDREAK